MLTAELFSSPTATYNGELIDKTLKLVERVPKPPGYDYGAVDSAGNPFLAAGLVLVMVLGAVIPLVLAIGETALKQQREYEAEDKISNNEFAKQNDKLKRKMK